MGKEDALGCLEKRDLLNQPAASVDALKPWADRFFNMGHWSDAIDFYSKINGLDALEKILQVALDEGDLFLYNRVVRVLGIKARREDLVKLAENAEALGKNRFASDALTQGGVDGVLLAKGS